MISRRDKLLNYPWVQQRHEQHIRKLSSAKAAIDTLTPPIYPHLITKPKKAQKEKERQQQIEIENIRLLQKLGDIMRTKHLQNFWVDTRPNFLNREKIFETRTSSSLPKLAANSDLERSQSAQNVTLKSKSIRRCPTCIGKPDRTIVKIPENRVPWEPLSKSWNIKSQNEILNYHCFHCGHLKKTAVISN